MNNTQKNVTFWHIIGQLLRRVFCMDSAVTLRQCEEFRQEHYLDLPPKQPVVKKYPDNCY